MDGTRIELRLLGPLSVSVNGQRVDLPGRRARALLACLALSRGRLVRRDRLVEALWVEPPRTAAKVVQIGISKLRKALGPRVVVSEPGGYRLALADDAVDLERFRSLAGAGRAMLRAGRHADAAALLDEAIDLWRGEFLAEFDDEPFAVSERRHVEGLRLDLLEDRFDALLALGRHAELLADLDRLVREHPERERLGADLIVALYRSGRQADALAVYRETRRRLLEEFGIEPGPALRRLERAVLAQDASLDEPPARRSVGGELPSPRGRFVGRDDEVNAICRLLGAGGVSFLTLTGTGGVGKTRLAIETARRLRALFEEGVVFVPLDTVTDPALVVPTIASALRLRSAEPSSSDRSRSRLVVLDSLEHLTGAAEELAALVTEIPRTTFLATSRERLRISPEQEFRIAPLRVPEVGVDELEALRDVPAVQLFVERARAGGRAFELSRSNAPTVAAICRRLEGIPLSLELAAARTQLLAPPVLLDRLDDRLAVLTAGPADARPRHRTLRATIQWSLDLLRDDERTLLQALSVFAGGWTLAAAEAVCRSDRLLDGLESLTDKSLIRRETGEEPRFAMLDSIREFAHALLADAGGHGDLRARHRAFFLGFAERASASFCGPEEAAWFDRLERDYANLAAAHDLALAECDGDCACRLAAVLGRYWLVRGHLAEGRRRLEASLAVPGATAGSRTRALTATGRLAVEQGALEDAQRFFESGLAVAEELGDRHRISVLSTELGTVALYRSDYSRARALFQESAVIDREDGDLAGLAVDLHELAAVAAAEGDLEEAQRLFDESMALGREAGSAYCVAAASRGLAGVLIALGVEEPVPTLLVDSLRLGDEVGDRHGVVEAVECVAMLVATRSDAATSALLLGASHRARESMANGEPQHVQARRAQALEAAAALPGRPYHGEYRRGLRLTLDEAVREARRLLSESVQPR